MGVTNDNQFGQGRVDYSEHEHGEHLFDPAPYTKEPHPGDLSYEKWLEHPDVMFHGTFRSDESLRDAPTIHSGTLKSAEQRLNSIASGLGVEPNADSTPTTPGHVNQLAHQIMTTDEQEKVFLGSHGARESVLEHPDVVARAGQGRIIPRRYERRGDDEYPGLLADTAANDYDAIYRRDIGAGVTGSIADSLVGSQRARSQSDDGDDDWSDHPAVGALYRGKRLPYRNDIEDADSISYVVPDWPQTTTGYWDDVEDSPNTTAAQKEMARIMRSEGETKAPFTAKSADTGQGALFTSSRGMGWSRGPEKWTTHPDGIFGKARADVQTDHFSRPDPGWASEEPAPGWVRTDEK